MGMSNREKKLQGRQKSRRYAGRNASIQLLMRSMDKRNKEILEREKKRDR